VTSAADSFDLTRWWRGAFDANALARIPWPLAIALCVVCPVLGTLAEWHWASVGMNWEVELLTQGRTVELPLDRMVALAFLAGSLLDPASVVLLQLALRALGCAPQPFGVLYRTFAVMSPIALLKALPWIGYFLALIAALVLPVILVARVQQIRLRTSALAVFASSIAGLPLFFAAGYLVMRFL